MGKIAIYSIPTGYRRLQIYPQTDPISVGAAWTCPIPTRSLQLSLRWLKDSWLLGFGCLGPEVAAGAWVPLRHTTIVMRKYIDPRVCTLSCSLQLYSR